MSLKRAAPRLPSVSSAELLSRVPLSEPEGFFVQEARRSGVCVTKMAQGRRPAFCCLSEECLLSGAGGGGDRRGAGIEKSGAFEGAEGQSLGTGAGKKKISPPLHPRRQRSTKSRQEESSKLGASPEWMLSFVLLLSATFVWSSPKLDVVLTRLRCFSTSFPLACCRWQRWARRVVDSLAEVCVAA